MPKGYTFGIFSVGAMNRGFNVLTPLGAEQLVFCSLSGTEELSRLFDFRLELRSPRQDLADGLVRQAVASGAPEVAPLSVATPFTFLQLRNSTSR